MRRLACWALATLFLPFGLLVACGGTASASNQKDSSVVAFARYAPGTIVVSTTDRRLFLVIGQGRALSYPIAVGKAGKEWSGTTVIARKVANPTWAAPAVVHADHPELPVIIPPGPSNPLGPRALVLATGEYAIHGTNHPESIGTKASYGCIRMYNRHILDLFQRVTVGTPVIVE